ncbi:MAG: WD40 repeat domain-containing protein [Anaerolineae bacterium]|nr:WD40 repeat domain-containing protein [Anaerolineae bacterium]
MQKRYRLPLLRASIIAIMLSLLVLTIPVQAQSSSDFVFPSEFYATSFAWSYDNHTLVFGIDALESNAEGAPILLDHTVWQTVDVLTETLFAPQTDWPLQPSLTPDEHAHFQPSGFALSAPDNTLFAFNRQGTLHFGNRATDEILETHFEFTDEVFLSQKGLKGFWSADSTAFIYPQDSPEIATQLFYHIRIHPRDLQKTVFTPFSDIPVEGVSYTAFDGLVDKLFDLSTDGSRVLLIAQKASSDPYDKPIPYLAVWYPEQSMNNRLVRAIPSEPICDAAFTSSDESQIVSIMNDGHLVFYDLVSNTVKVLSSSLPTNCGFISSFSYNGAWLALFDGGLRKLRFLNITQLISENPTPTQPPHAEAGTDQTLTDTDGDGLAQAIVSGTASVDPNSHIASMIWGQGVARLPSGKDQTITVGLGKTTYTFTVTDNNGFQGSDDMVITLLPAANKTSVN